MPTPRVTGERCSHSGPIDGFHVFFTFQGYPHRNVAQMSRVSTHGKHASGNMLPDATMSHLNICQRCALASSLVPLLDTMHPNFGISCQKSLEALYHTAAVAAEDDVQPHPEQGGE